MYMAGLSYRGMTERTGLIPASHVTVYYWVQKLRGLIHLCKPRVGRAVAVDEMMLKVKGQHLFVWAAIDVDFKEALAVDASWQRPIMNAEHILKEALRSCLNKPVILVDKGPWYPDALKSLSLSYKHVTRGLRSRIERWFRILKERTKQFYNNFPSRKRCIKGVKIFLETFTYGYINLRTHQTLKRPPTQPLS